jgi:hypothetical protein
MNTRRLFSRWFALVAASAAGVSACGPTITAEQFSASVCTNGAYVPLVGLTPAVPVDYLELRSAASGPSSENTRGMLCATATDRARCMSAYAAINEPRGWSVSPGFTQQLVFTRGDEVGVVASLDELRAFLAPVDAPADAALLATASGFRVRCDGANVRPAATGYELRLFSGTTCGRNTGLDVHVVAVSRAGEVRALQTERLEDSNPNCVIGRRTEGVSVGAVARDASVLGAYFADMAALESSAVRAFERLARELDALGAPATLIARARSAARDEVRHARVAGSLARRFGASAPSVTTEALAVRDRLAVARENAVEGCVRETFGALVGTFQARAARDPDVARAMGAIARDETEHAALAWDVAAWLEPQLTDAERASLARDRAEALDALTRGASVAADEALVATVGAPTPAQTHALLAPLRATLWS